MSKERKKAFEVLVLFHKEEINEQGIVTGVDTKFAVEPKVILATNENDAKFQANRLVPEVMALYPELLELRIRPF